MAHKPQTIAAAISTGLGTPFTVPAGEKYIVTHFRVTNTGVANVVTVSGINGGYASGVNLMIEPLAAAAAAGSHADYYGRTTFVAGEAMQTVATVGTAALIVDYERHILG